MDHTKECASNKSVCCYGLIDTAGVCPECKMKCHRQPCDCMPDEVQIVNAYCFALISRCRKTNATEMKITQHGVHHLGEPLGDWEIVVRRIKAPKKQ